MIIEFGNKGRKEGRKKERKEAKYEGMEYYDEQRTEEITAMSTDGTVVKRGINREISPTLKNDITALSRDENTI